MHPYKKHLGGVMQKCLSPHLHILLQYTFTLSEQKIIVSFSVLTQGQQ